MNDDNTKLLKTAFKSLYNDRFYFECGDGWFGLLFEVGVFITNATDHCKIVQIKEKFGALRIYAQYDVDDNGYNMVNDSTSARIGEFLHNVESRSIHICEDCGVGLTTTTRQPQSRLGYWIQNICVTCAEERKIQQNTNLLKP